MLARLLSSERSSCEVGSILLGHLEHRYAFYGEAVRVRIARKHLRWYAYDSQKMLASRLGNAYWTPPSCDLPLERARPQD